MFFISLINKIIERTKLRFIAFKIKIYNFLIHEIKYLLIENKKSIIYIYINNALKYKIIKKKLYNININVKFTIYIAYQNEIFKKFNKTITTIIKAMLVQSKLLLFF